MSIPILASGGPVEINDDFEAILLRPTDSLRQVGTLALQVRLTWSNIVRPIPDWDANVIQSNNRHELAPRSGTQTHAPGSGNHRKVILGNPIVPMVGQLCESDVGVLVLSKCPLIDDSRVARVVKQRRFDPRL